jgi:hypothetical protein
MPKRRVSQPDDDEVILQPWFMPKPVALQIRRILPSVHLAKMRYYFEDYGCIRCEKKTALYASNGFCENCATLVRSRIVNCLKRRLKGVGEGGPRFTESKLEDATWLARQIVSKRSRTKAGITPRG